MINLRDAIRSFVPVWLSDRVQLGLTRAFAFIYSLVTPQDAVLEHTTQAVQARFPGVGTNTALPYLGNDREVLRGPTETEEAYVARLQNWLYYAKRRGSRECIARMIHEFLPGNPKVRVISRSGAWTTIDTAGVLTEEYLPGSWNWDGNSHPERASSTWDIWIVIYQSHYSVAPNWGTGSWGGPNCLGIAMPREVFADLVRTISIAKSAHSIVRSILITSNVNDFSPSIIGSLMPDGWWGNYGRKVGANQVAARPLTVRFYDEVY